MKQKVLKKKINTMINKTKAYYNRYINIRNFLKHKIYIVTALFCNKLYLKFCFKCQNNIISIPLQTIFKFNSLSQLP